MNLKLAYDTETTGIPDFGQPSEAPHQPHIVQLAARLINVDTRKSIASMDVIVKPNGWTIPDDVSKIHGITTEHTMDVGIPEEMAVEMLLAMWAGRPLIGHNESFDRRIVRIGIKRLIDPFNTEAEPVSDRWKAAKGECTCLLSTPICKIPPTAKMKAAGFNKFKSANLTEAHMHFTGKPLLDAHSAMADVDGCLAVYWAIQDLLNPPAAVAPELQTA